MRTQRSRQELPCSTPPFHREGIRTGIVLDALIAISVWLDCVLGRRLECQPHRAGTFPAT